MPRLYRAVATGLALTLLASCAGSDTRLTSASDAKGEAKADEGAAEIVVTGQSIANAPADRASRISTFAPPAPPAPPPSLSSPQQPSVPSPGMTTSRLAKRAAPEPRPYPPYYQDVGRDKFTSVDQNAFKIVKEEPVSTFSLDVDTASYSFVRASLNQNTLPQPAAVRTEEMVNYFPYDYAPAAGASQPFSTNVAVFPSPWTPGRKLVRIGVKGYEIGRRTRPRANLVFLIDTSGSMYAPNKLPLVKQSLEMLLDQLDGNDSVAIVTYAGSAGTALEPTPASEKARIKAVIEGLGAGGSTAGAEGIRQAYRLAEQHFDAKGVNRVILTTDGDFNVGITNQDELKGYIERERGKGVFLSVLGFGMGNYNDAMMQTLAQNGNGTAAYIDTVNEARKTLVDEATSTLFPIAKDVKIQVEFNPRTVAEYRLIGYETRMLKREDFDNDKVDAGDVGSGQTVTALYEVVPVGGPRANGDLRYAAPAPVAAAGLSGELGFVKIRYKLPKSDASLLLSTPIDRRVQFARFEDAPQDARFATAVAGFAELLRGGRYNGALSYDDVLRMASGAKGKDEFGYRTEFIQLVRTARIANGIAATGQ